MGDLFSGPMTLVKFTTILGLVLSVLTLYMFLMARKSV
jgi:hypothetical protein